MPSVRTVPSLTQISICCLSELFGRTLHPQYLSTYECNLKRNESKDSDIILTKELPEETENEETTKAEVSPPQGNIVSSEISEIEKNGEIIKAGVSPQGNTVSSEISEESPSQYNEEDGPRTSEYIEKGQRNSFSKECLTEHYQIIEKFLVSLANDLTSHAHCTLQETCFWSVLYPLNRLYTKQYSQETRKLIKNIVPLFINPFLRVLDFGAFKMFTESTMFEILYSRLHTATSLEKLIFGRSCYWRSKSIQNLSEVLQSLSNLQVLHVEYICRPEMLQGLPDSCPQLRELSVKGSKDITNEEVPVLVRFLNIDTLDISGTTITGKGCRRLVLELPRLVWLTHCPFNCNSDLLIFQSRADLFHHIKDQLPKQPVTGVHVPGDSHVTADSGVHVQGDSHVPADSGVHVPGDSHVSAHSGIVNGVMGSEVGAAHPEANSGSGSDDSETVNTETKDLVTHPSNSGVLVPEDGHLPADSCIVNGVVESEVGVSVHPEANSGNESSTFDTVNTETNNPATHPTNPSEPEPAKSDNQSKIDQPQEENRRFKMKSFWLFNPTTEELHLTSLCPEIEFLRLDFVMQDLPEPPDTEGIRHLAYLRSLALFTYDRCPIQLVTSVMETATTLTTLHLHLGDEWFFVAPVVNTLAQSCPNLTSLTMDGDYKGHHSLEEADARLDFTLPPGGLPHLQEAKLAGCVSDLRLMHLLTQAPNLQVLHLDGELEWLHDDTITEAIRQDLLLQLRVMWFNVSAGVTFSSVRRLLMSENNLQKVGRLCLMSSATKQAYQDLLRLIKRLNLATELIWVTDQRQLRDLNPTEDVVG